MEGTRDRLVRYLQDAHAAEVGIAEMLEGFANDADANDAVRGLITEHLAVTRSQSSRLEQRLRELGHEPSGGKGFFNSLMGRISDIMNVGHDEYDRITQNLIKCYATEHLEQGMYSSLIAYAESCGDEKTAMLAEEIMSEEEEAALKIFPMIEVCAQRAFDASQSTPR